MQHLACVIEDDQALRVIYRRILAQAGFAVLEAGEGKQALALLQDHAPAVIILDILLPYVNGQEVLNYINHAPHLSNTHVIIISSSARYEQLLDSTPHGHFFLKPVHPVDIANLLAQVVQAEV